MCTPSLYWWLSSMWSYNFLHFLLGLAAPLLCVDTEWSLRFCFNATGVLFGQALTPGCLQDKGYSLSGGAKGMYPLVSSCQENGDRPIRRENPHKYLLYKPTFSQIMVFLASGEWSSFQQDGTLPLVYTSLFTMLVFPKHNILSFFPYLTLC